MTEFLYILPFGKISPLVIIFLAVFLLILLVRAFFALLIFFAKKVYAKSKNTAALIKKDMKKFLKEDEELLRKLDELPKAHSATRAGKIGQALQPQGKGYELMVSKEQEQEKTELSQAQIVDIVKPIGFWTSVILGQKLTYLIQSAQIINKRGNQGFWVSMIEAQEQAAGRQHGRTH